MTFTIFDDLVDPSSGPIAGEKPVQSTMLAYPDSGGRDEHGKSVLGGAVTFKPVVIVKKMERFRTTDGDELIRNGVVYADPVPMIDLTWQLDLKDGFGLRKVIYIDSAPDEGPDGYQAISFT